MRGPRLRNWVHQGTQLNETHSYHIANHLQILIVTALAYACKLCVQYGPASTSQARNHCRSSGSCQARCTVSRCTQSRLTTTTAEAHDADRPAGLAASCHHVAVHSLTAIHHSRGTRCRSPCRARCIVSSCRCAAACTQSQLSSTAEAHDADRPTGLAALCHRVAALSHNYPPQPRRTMQIALPGSLHRVAVRSVPAFNHVRAICTCCESPASGAVTSLAPVAVQTSPFLKKPQAQGGTCCSSPWRAHCTLCAIYANLQVHNHLVLVLHHSA